MEAVRRKLYDFCREYITLRSSRLRNNMSGMMESLESETKSSAGDKHETGRAMIQLELEKLGNQLAEIQKLEEQFKKVSQTSGNDTISLGSVVHTDMQYYYIAISAGAVALENTTYYAIAPNSPIGMLLMGKKVGASFSFNGKKITITAIG